MNSSINTTMGRREWLMLIVLSLLWGTSFLAIEIALRELSPLWIVTLRITLAALALWVMVLLLGLRPKFNATIWWAFLIMGLTNNVIPFNLIVWGQQFINSGLAAILNATTPIFSVLVAALMLHDEKPGLGKFIGVGFGFIGTVLMIGPQALEGIGDDVLGQLAILGASLSYALSAAFGRRFNGLGLNPLVSAAGMLTVSSALLLPLALILGSASDVLKIHSHTVLALLSLAILSTALAYQIYFRVLASSGATNILLVTFLIPVSAVLLGYVFLQESLRWEHFAGMALIGLGLLAIDGRLLRQLGKDESRSL